MSTTKIALLGAIAGLTIFIGLPLGRLRRPAPRLKAALNGVAIGVLLFLVWDILSHAWEPTDAALAHHEWSVALRGGLVLAAGLAVGLAGLVHYDKLIAARRAARVLRPDPVAVPVGAAASAPGAPGAPGATGAPGPPGAPVGPVVTWPPEPSARR